MFICNAGICNFSRYLHFQVTLPKSNETSLFSVCSLFVLIDRTHRFAHVAVYGVEQNEASKYVPNTLHKIPKGNLYLYSSVLFVLSGKHQSLVKVTGKCLN